VVEMKVFTFVGTGDTLYEAIEAAAGRSADWLATHQWHTPEGLPGYTLTTAALHENTLYTYVMHYFGPAEETRTAPGERAYTGQTERLG
jgi:hypothetical protein